MIYSSYLADFVQGSTWANQYSKIFVGLLDYRWEQNKEKGKSRFAIAAVKLCCLQETHHRGWYDVFFRSEFNPRAKLQSGGAI